MRENFGGSDDISRVWRELKIPNLLRHPVTSKHNRASSPVALLKRSFMDHGTKSPVGRLSSKRSMQSTLCHLNGVIIASSSSISRRYQPYTFDPVLLSNFGRSRRGLLLPQFWNNDTKSSTSSACLLKHASSRRLSCCVRKGTTRRTTTCS